MTTAAADDWSEGRDGQHRRYRERLHPPIIVLLLAIGLAAIVGIAYGAAYGAAWGWGVSALMGVIGIGVLLATSIPIHVDERVLRAGRARLPLTAIAHVSPLDAEAMRQARRHGDPRDYLVLRAWSSRRGVAIDLNDAHDPHPRWIISSRHPEQLTEAIRKAIPEGTMRADGPEASE